MLVYKKRPPYLTYGGRFLLNEGNLCSNKNESIQVTLWRYKRKMNKKR